MYFRVFVYECVCICVRVCRFQHVCVRMLICSCGVGRGVHMREEYMCLIDKIYTIDKFESISIELPIYIYIVFRILYDFPFTI